MATDEVKPYQGGEGGAVDVPSDASDGKGSPPRHLEDMEMAQPGYGKERGTDAADDVLQDDNPNVHQHMNWNLFVSLTAMSFLWVGSQIPLYLFGSVIVLIYSDIGGYDRYVWLVIGYLIPNAALCPFVGALSDMFGRRSVAAIGQVLLIMGPIITCTAHSMNIAIAGQVFSGLGAGLNELISLAGTAELVPYKKRGTYVGAVVFTILPFCPSVLWAQLIAKASSWRYVGILVCVWNLIGLILILAFYKDPSRLAPSRKKMEILREVDFVGGFLSTIGVLCFMMGMQWGAQQYTWGSTHVLAPFIIGIVLIIAFFVWEIMFAPHPMVPKALFSKDKRTMIAILLITFWSGGNYFVLLLFWPTQCYNVYGEDPVGVGIRALPVGFGIILGAAITLMMIPVVKGRTTPLMIFATALMTAFTGAMSIGRPDNLSTMYGLITVASLAVGCVIIPCSIIAQIVCPVELIGTITAITLSIRYIGGAIAFTAYDNSLYHKFLGYTQSMVAQDIFFNQVAYDKPTITALVTLAAQSKFAELKEYIAATPTVTNKANAYDIVIGSTQHAYALAYRYPYWISIAFGAISFVCAFFLRDIKKFL